MIDTGWFAVLPGQGVGVRWSRVVLKRLGERVGSQVAPSGASANGRRVRLTRRISSHESLAPWHSTSGLRSPSWAPLWPAHKAAMVARPRRSATGHPGRRDPQDHTTRWDLAVVMSRGKEALFPRKPPTTIVRPTGVEPRDFERVSPLLLAFFGQSHQRTQAPHLRHVGGGRQRRQSKPVRLGSAVERADAVSDTSGLARAS